MDNRLSKRHLRSALSMAAICLVGVALVAVAGAAEARLVALRWRDPNPAPSPVAGFRVYVGTISRVYDTPIELGLPSQDAGGIFSVLVTVPDGVQVFLAMSSYDTAGLESGWSNELILQPIVTPPVDALPIGQIDSPSGAVTITAGESVVFAGSGSDPDGGPVSYLWEFDSVGSSVPVSTQKDPGSVMFPNWGTFLVSMTVTDDEGNPDPSPATVVVDVQPFVSPPPPPNPGPGPGFTGLRRASRVTADGVLLTAPSGDTRLFVVARSGVVRIVEGGNPRPIPFLDLSDSVMTGSEGGLLGLAFDPDYGTNGYFFVYRVDSSGDAVLSRFSRGENVYVADRASELELLRVPLAFGGNAGGGLAFGPDGFLFIGIGDGGGSGDPGNRAQDRMERLGKVLRIDVGVPARNGSIPAGAYSIPSDNPFVGVSGTLEEIWAIGLRNPYRISVDRQTGGLFIADQGSGLREEIDFEPGTDPGGRNYGWDVTEGMVCNPNDPAPAPGCNAAEIVDPIFDYVSGGVGCGIVGGYAYRGALPGFQGEYFFADSCSGRVWSYDRASDRLTNRTLQFVEDGTTDAMALGLGEGGTGELYVLAADGQVFEIRSDRPACRDGVDNDGDGRIDYPADPGCASADSEIEVPLCDDGFDNDLDGDVDADDAQCTSPHLNAEGVPIEFQAIGEELFCGLGAELVLVFPIFMWARGGVRRLRRRG